MAWIVIGIIILLIFFVALWMVRKVNQETKEYNQFKQEALKELIELARKQRENQS